MKLDHLSPPAALRKAPSGITGFDEITGGGLPRGRTTLLVGGPGSGKTVFALQYLINGARSYGEPGIFVAFEETSERIMANAESFDWKLAQLQRKKLLFTLDAQKAELEVRLKAVQTELIAKQLEKTLLARTTASREAVILDGSERMRELRGGDAPRKHK